MFENVGFIGLGNMGAPMALRLQDKARQFTVFDVRKAAAAPYTARGGVLADSVAALAARCEIVFLSLPTPEIVRDVAIGANGIGRGGKIRILVDLSTTGPRTTEHLDAELKERNIQLIDAPVSGGLAGARNGTLAVMASGARESFTQVEPLLADLGRVFYVGEKPGLGQTMKLCNNLLSAAALAISSEAVVMGVKAGLDPKMMLDVINTGSGRNSATQDKFPKAILPRRFDFGFATSLMYKDVRLCLEEAEHLGVPMWVAPAVRQLWQQACIELGPQSDFTAIVKCIERLAKVQVGSHP
jgi:3-hydroxyisobutyrate dehydrogenase-like beta-hydroxyacid dehydrogenase